MGNTHLTEGHNPLLLETDRERTGKEKRGAGAGGGRGGGGGNRRHNDKETKRKKARQVLDTERRETCM